MAKYKYDADTMIEKIRETWLPEDFLQATKNLMYTKKSNDKRNIGNDWRSVNQDMWRLFKK